MKKPSISFENTNDAYSKRFIILPAFYIMLNKCFIDIVIGWIFWSICIYIDIEKPKKKSSFEEDFYKIVDELKKDNQ